jgi:hypothetical protein
MPCPRRDSRQQDGIIVRRMPQRTFATKSVKTRKARSENMFPLRPRKRTLRSTITRSVWCQHATFARRRASKNSLQAHLGTIKPQQGRHSTAPKVLGDGQVHKSAAIPNLAVVWLIEHGRRGWEYNDKEDSGRRDRQRLQRGRQSER